MPARHGSGRLVRRNYGGLKRAALQVEPGQRSKVGIGGFPRVVGTCTDDSAAIGPHNTWRCCAVVCWQSHLVMLAALG